MKRYKAFDPPEYQNWTLDDDVLQEFKARVHEHPERRAIIQALDASQLLDLYRGMLRARLHDIYLKRWVKTGVLSKAWLATGEEAVTIGAVAALRKGPNGDVVGPMIRNASACIEMGIPLQTMFATYLAELHSTCKGRDLHIGDLTHGVIAPVSHVGSLQPVMVGSALAFAMRNEDRVALTWVGDGATRTGEIHEGLSFAASTQAPVITIIQNNQIALGTKGELYNKGDFATWPAAYGMNGATADGNNVLDVYAATMLAVQHAREGKGPSILVAETFRMGGHATHDEAEARCIFRDDDFVYWGKRDPIGVFEAYLTDPEHPAGISTEDLTSIEADVIQEMEDASAQALQNRTSHTPTHDELMDGIYA